MYESGYLSSPEAVLRVADPALLTPPGGADEFTQDQLSDLAAFFAGLRIVCVVILCMRIRSPSPSPDTNPNQVSTCPRGSYP